MRAQGQLVEPTVHAGTSSGGGGCSGVTVGSRGSGGLSFGRQRWPLPKGVTTATTGCTVSGTG